MVAGRSNRRSFNSLTLDLAFASLITFLLNPKLAPVEGPRDFAAYITKLGALTIRRGAINCQIMQEHDPINVASGCEGDFVVDHIFAHLSGVAFQRVAVSGAA